ncbi:MAG: STAS domain-containing protein [Chitinivibrionales bacterium]|nr:STAS domain-containing protein [Chitinivibrionales bacterium]MBD3357404.1 STAS domain-containing protein [Chitinivibrionales bacterium]
MTTRKGKLMDIATSTWQDWTIVAIQGGFVVRHLVDLRNTLDSLEKHQTPRVALDLSGTSYMDSSAISLILNIKSRFEARGGGIAVFGANKELRELFSIVDLQQVVSIYPDQSAFEAAMSFSS